MKFSSEDRRQKTTMADITNTTRGVTQNSSADKMRKLLSPGSKKSFVGGHRTFDVPLVELVNRAPKGYKVPYIVKKLCTYIEHNGLGVEGIFRVNGNARIVEKLKTSFDLHGDANLDEDNDILAVAGLLKLFLREMPDSVIPEHMTRQFLDVQEQYQRNAAECVRRLKVLLKDFPEENYDLLKHMIRFLVIVTCNESVNKMSPMALAIVFGPNLFRCGKGFGALKDQGTTNQIVYRFIADYNNLFLDPGEETPAVYWERKKHNLVPPRPPPPKFAVEEVSVRPVPSPRKSKMKTYEGSHYPDHDEQDFSESSISSKGRNSGSHQSPAFSDDEMTGRISPFHLDSDSGFSMVESPVPSARTSEFVDKAIKDTVIGHLFGDESSLLNASIDTTVREDQTEPLSESLERPFTGETPNNLKSDSAGVKNRMRQFDKMEDSHNVGAPKPRQQKGVIITQILKSSSDEKDDEDRDIDSEHIPDGFDDVRRDSDPLVNFKRPAGPPNRRSPSWALHHRPSDSEEETGVSNARTPGWTSHHRPGDSDEDKMDEQEIESVKLIPNGHIPSEQRPVPVGSKHTDSTEEINHNHMKSRIAFLDIRNDSPKKFSPDQSPEKSPLGEKKPFVPPLDFSTLHEHVGSQDAIPARKAQTVSYQRAKQQFQHSDQEEENEDPSPKSNHVKRKAGDVMDEDLPPFSQVNQDQYKLHSHGSTDDELTSKMKYMMKKIQGLKKKIKQFEELFEQENGYKPSHSEKAARPEIKKHLTELSKARKEAKKLKEEAEMGSRSRHGSGASSTGERTEPPDLPPTMAQTLDVILKRLKDKRKEAQRPEDIELMKHEQVQDEKLSVQKALLHFEGIHGRPKTRDEKDLMRPLYDRYRTIKRLLSRQPMSPRNTDLPTVPEDHPIEITDQRQTKLSDPVMIEPVRVNPIHVPTADIEEEDEDEGGGPSLVTMDFAVTRDLGILRDAVRPLAEKQGPHSPKAKRKLDLQENIENRNTEDSNLHELSVPELHDQLMKSRNSKKRLRKVLRDYEEAFVRNTGRKVSREDRIPMQSEYNEYKQLKARLKLLEALLSKHNAPDV